MGLSHAAQQAFKCNACLESNTRQRACNWGRGKLQRKEDSTSQELRIDQALDWIIRRIDKIEHKLNRLIEGQWKIMATLDETLAEVTAEDTKVDSIIALIGGLQQQLADALSGATLPPGVQAKVDQIFAQATASAGKIDTAISANTPPTP